MERLDLDLPRTETRSAGSSPPIAEGSVLPRADDFDPVWLHRVEVLLRVSALLGLGAGASGLVGWAFGIPRLKSLLPGTIGIVPNTAVCLILLSSSLFLVSTRTALATHRALSLTLRAGQLLASVSALIGLLCFTEHVLGWDWGIDELLFRSSPADARGLARPGLMSPLTAIDCMLLGVALALQHDPRHLPAWRSRTASTLGVLAGLVALVGLLDYLLAPARAYTQIALNTALALELLSVAVACVPSSHGLGALLVSATLGGVVIRRMLPAAIGIPLVMGASWWHAYVSGFAPWYYATWTILAMIGSLGGVSLWTSLLLRAKDEKHRAIRKALAESESQLSAIIESTSDLIFAVDAQRFGLVILNRALRERFGDQAIPGATPHDLLPPDHASQWLGYYTRALREGSFRTEYRAPVGDLLFDIRFHPLMRDGETFGIAAYARDITNQKHIEQELRDAREHLEDQVEARTAELAHAYEQVRSEKERLNVLLQSMDDEVWLAGTDETLALVNPSSLCNTALALPGGRMTIREYAERIVVLRADGSPRPIEEHPAQRALHGEAIRNEEEIVRGSEGALYYRQLNARPVRDGTGTILGAVCVVRDVTEQRRADAARQRAEARYRQIVETSQEGIIVVDSEGMIAYANPQMLRLFRCDIDDLLGRSVMELAFPEDLEEVRARWMELRHGAGFASVELRRRRFDGTELWTLMNASPLHDDDGKFVGTLAMMFDISERKRLDDERSRLVEQLQCANAQLMELDRLKSMFIASVSHELRTPLNSVIGFSGVMLQGLAGGLSPEQQKQLSIIKSSGEHLLALITDVIDVSKIEAGIVGRTDSEFDLGELVREVVETLARTSHGQQLTLTVEAEGAHPIVSDKRRVRQILVNLVANALKFTDRGGIAARVTWRDGGIEVSVQDTGIGIARADLQKLFQPFVQIHTQGRAREGSGLGLHLARKLAELLGGRLEAESELGVGSVFRLWLPASTGRS